MVSDEALYKLADSVILTTTPTVPGHDIDAVVKIVSAQSVIAMNIFRDIANAWRDVGGGRSGTLESALRDGRENCLAALRFEAARAGADAVVGIDLDYTEFSSSLVSGGMVMAVASGTAVRLKDDQDMLHILQVDDLTDVA